MNRLALGTVQFGLPYGIANQSGQVSRLEAQAMLHMATASGINILDTAIAYGESETCLGEIGTQDYRLVTKLPPVPAECSDVNDWVEEQISASFKRLGVMAVYGLLLHRADQLLGANGNAIYQAMQGLKNSGRVKKVGISIYAPGELDAIIKLFQLDLVQAPFNLIDRRLLTTGWLHRLKAEGVEIHTRSALLQGLLLMPISAIPNKFNQWRELLTRWHQWLALNNITPVKGCISFALSHPEIDHVIVGADNVVHLKQIIDAAASRNEAVIFPDLSCDDLNLIDPSRWRN